MDYKGIRNVAIIAHVDHGKTTMVDRILQATGVFRSNQDVPDQVLDSNDQERERGITILSKNVSVRYKDVKINIIDTPGHSDFGGEVERVLNMADGALVIVDAFEGPMPQTRFVLRKALELGLRPVLVVNKIDRPGARPEEVLDDVFDLMIDLNATDEQLDFPVVYTSAAEGYARFDPKDGNDDMTPLLDTILESVPEPSYDNDGPIAMQICTVSHSNFVGRIGIGRLHSGHLANKQTVLVKKPDGSSREVLIKQLYTFEALGQVECEEAFAGDIVAIVGIDDADIGDMVTSPDNPVDLPPITIEEPTMAVVFEASTSPLVGQEGDIVGARQLKERLMREAESNVTMRIEELEDKSGIEVAGRGVLHLSVLMETMRREGYEFQVGRPRVLYKKADDGTKLEPIEEATIEVLNEYAGKCIETMGNAGGEMVDMVSREEQTFMTFHIPTRGVMGLATKLMNVSHGEAIFSHRFLEYDVFRGELTGRKNGVMVAMYNDKAVAYALDTLQTRGIMFVGPGDQCYEGMIVGEHAKENDLVVNVSKTKQLTNTRAASADKAILLTPPTTFTLEEALEYIQDDELVEITPQTIRMRKRILSKVDRRKAARV
ncbi:MAG: translational GTPase TypA [Coriobacteriales bacterium]|jgi:GTP-binding protein